MNYALQVDDGQMERWVEAGTNKQKAIKQYKDFLHFAVNNDYFSVELAGFASDGTRVATIMGWERQNEPVTKRTAQAG